MLETKLAPGLLLSMPQLSDPNFTRAVVLMLEHSDTGSFGLIVNHESSLSVAEVVSTVDVRWQGSATARVYSGGPVMPGSAWVLHSGSDALGAPSRELDEALESTGHLQVAEGLYMSTSEDNIKYLAENPPEHMRFLLGYAGWGPSQLAAEMSQGSWLHADIDVDILFNSPIEDMWQRCLARMGIDPEAIVASRGVH